MTRMHRRTTTLGRLGFLLVLLLVVGQSTGGPLPAFGAQGGPPTPVAVQDPAERKVDSVLLDLLLNYQLNGLSGPEAYARQRGLLTDINDVRVTLVLVSSDVQPVVDTVTGMGGTVT